MHVRKAEKSDIDALQGFWKAKGMPEVPLECFPPFGLVAVDDAGVLIGGAFLAFGDASVASVGFISANPTLTRDSRCEGLDACIEGLIGYAREMGVSVVSAATNVRSLQERYLKLGFFKTDENVVHFARRV